MPSSDLSPFPAGYCGVELFYDNVWNDITPDVDQKGMRIQHGKRSESGTADASSLAFTVQNPTGKYSPRNPASSLYGKIGRNTPVRCFVNLGLPWINLDGTINARLTTPDSVALSITGDIDLRWYGYRDDWHRSADLISKADSSSQFSYVLWCANDGKLGIYWSTDGGITTGLFWANATLPVPSWAGTLAVRATLDVNNGAGGITARFYTSDSLSGTWKQLGDDIIYTGSTSIFNSTSSVVIGQNPASIGQTESPRQRIYGWEIRDGIGGTIISSIDATALTVGATSFSDGSNTWTLQTGSSITKRNYLFSGEVSEWPMSWNLKGSESVLSSVDAAGILRRLGQGDSPLNSPWRRGVETLTTVVAYWPMEDEAGATQLGPVIGSRAMKWSGTLSLANFAGFDASAPVPTIGLAKLTASVGNYTATGVQVRGLWNVPNTTPNNAVLLRLLCKSATIARVDMCYSTFSGLGDLYLKAYDYKNALVFTGSTYQGEINNADKLISVELSDNGTGTDLAIVGLGAGDFAGSFVKDTFALSDLGQVTAVLINPDGSSLGNLAVGHITVENTVTDIFTLIKQLEGYSGEQADNRIYRLAVEATGAASVRGASGSSATMTKQGTESLLTLLREAESADGGILHDDREQLGIRYRTLESMYSQPAALTIAYTDNLVIPFEPLDDDARTRNKVTVERAGGSSFTVEETTGALSTADFPNGVGIYDESVTLKLLDDSRLEDQAGWRVHLGTTDEARFPVLGVDLAHPTFLNNNTALRNILTLWIGDRVLITNPPAWLPPDDVDQIIQGVQIDILPKNLRIRWICVPARPFRAARFGNSADRYSGSGTTAASMTSTATSMVVTPPAGVEWTHADGNYDVMVAGERMTVTAVTALSSGTQTMTVTRSVNGVVKAQSASTLVKLADPCYYGLLGG